MTEDLDFTLTLYPDPLLRRVARPVDAFDERLTRIVAGMLRRMRLSQGVGLAAPQVGLDERVLVLNPSGEERDDLVLVNPTIVARSGPLTSYDEGCLSFPGIYASIKRPERCRVRAVDPAGRPFEAEYDGFVSRIVQHEYDHLEGVLLVDRMSPADKVVNRAHLEELVDGFRRRRAAQPVAGS